MNVENLEALRYPVGPMPIHEKCEDGWFEVCLTNIKDFPEKLISFLDGFPPEFEQYTYRSGGWTSRQIVHHLSDSHVNAYIRLKLALTENLPTINPYNEVLWAEMSDTKLCSLNDSLLILQGIHSRWYVLLETMSESDFEKKYFHPGMKEYLTLSEMTRMYDWHMRHHFAHLVEAGNNFNKNILL